MKTAFAASVLASAASAWSNNVPVYGYFPGWKDGLGKAGIEISIFEDLLCSACAAENPVINEVMATPWLNGVVADYITITFTMVPLPYHIFAF
jgi:hypothetical protein